MIEEIGRQFHELGSSAMRGGFVVAAGGNFSCRTRDGSYAISASGVDLDKLGPADVVETRVDSSERAEGASSEWKMHTAVYRVRPDVQAIVHLHPQNAIFAQIAGIEVQHLTLDHASYIGRTAIAPFGPNGSWRLADDVAAAAREADVVVMSHHGVCALGTDLHDAYRRAVNYEQAAHMSIQLRLLGIAAVENPFDDPKNRLHL